MCGADDCARCHPELQWLVKIYCNCGDELKACYTDECISCGATVCDNCERCERCADLWAQAVDSCPTETHDFWRGWVQGQIDLKNKVVKNDNRHHVKSGASYYP